MRICLVGNVKFSADILNALIRNNFDVVGVVCDIENTLNTDYFDLGSICQEHNIPVLKTGNINQMACQTWLKSRATDLVLCVGWSQLLSKDVLKIPTIGVLAYHPSLLPLNRGRHPIIWALALGLKETGSTFFWATERVDAGKIVSQRNIAIFENDKAKDLYERLTRSAVDQLLTLLPKMALGRILGYEQNESCASYWRRRSVTDGKIDWRMTSRSIFNLVRALSNPYPGATFRWNGRDCILWDCQIVEEVVSEGIEPGKVIGTKKSGTTVKTGDGCVILTKTQPSLDADIGDYLS